MASALPAGTARGVWAVGGREGEWRHKRAHRTTHSAVTQEGEWHQHSESKAPSQRANGSPWQASPTTLQVGHQPAPRLPPPPTHTHTRPRTPRRHTLTQPCLAEGVAGQGRVEARNQLRPQAAHGDIRSARGGGVPGEQVPQLHHVQSGVRTCVALRAPPSQHQRTHGSAPAPARTAQRRLPRQQRSRLPGKAHRKAHQAAHNHGRGPRITNACKTKEDRGCQVRVLRVKCSNRTYSTRVSGAPW